VVKCDLSSVHFDCANETRGPIASARNDLSGSWHVPSSDSVRTATTTTEPTMKTNEEIRMQTKAIQAQIMRDIANTLRQVAETKAILARIK